ncbi:MAG: diacylglycerol kinase family lipid kinase [Clostridiaceae bacterium]|jgi:YegS/Rv2252/BmrU family lipid kinase|nr:diacylglycerol kinase family lipid kinase [Clostridiaceae bacterium]
MRRRLLFVVNAKAGKGQIKNHLLSIIDHFVSDQYAVEVYTTQQPHDAARIAAETGDQYDLLLCSGGDGTLNEIVNGLMKLEDKRPLIGYIPAGSTNDFAYNLYDTTNVKQIVAAIRHGRQLDCDIGRFNDLHFIYCAAFGAFALTSYETDQAYKNVLGRVAYLLEATNHLNTLKPYHFTVKYDQKTIEDDFIYGMVTNSDSVAGIRGFGGHNVQLDDGLFEGLLIRMPKNLFDLQQIIASLIKLDFSSDLFYSFKTSAVVFTSEEAISWNLDGEFGGKVHNAMISICQRAVTFLAPGEEA